MRVIVYAQDLSGRRDDGRYSKPDLESALDIFFSPDAGIHYSDPEGEHLFRREDAAAAFNDDRRVTFYNEQGEKVVIAADTSV